MGVERLALLLQNSDAAAAEDPQLFIAALGDMATAECFKLLTDLQRSNIRAEMDYTGRSLKAQLKRADKIRARYALIVGEDEIQQGKAQLRNMDDGSQQEISLADSVATLSDLLKQG